ncbi:hypothetical protein RirG_154690 [Rhizophagus irregularis DAOM 197198w]|uniref:C2H2-type domain-containing protein n=2 Tax=Rhizophagus irregularis (strain DAOM 197198w) TaxID=1432141 RepID=A0A015K6S9_RHIIW|nr:hypothetical protein RirG_154690 [Rhizophagus irregularis DAOM 197198w]EXX63184.1 hypothetical protein RirG_154690 [Rhizophagus irregularis DAOM 197198w]EXX63185.1 hypothetical protein RirG_154690 [Rhizophagus irregularis DAOM 197198w]
MSSQSICCKLCFKTFTTYQKLLIHERNRHLYNKTIPHFYSLPQPSSEQMFYYINSFIVLIKKKLGFSRHAVGKKRFSIDTFPENVFVYLFKNEEKFKYSPARHKYQCSFEGSVGAARLKEIFHYDHWSFRQDPFTNTKGYVLLENYENTYQVKFSWSQMTLLENNREFMLGRMTCNFITDSGEFQENNEEQILTSNNKQKIPEKPVEGKFHYILPRPPLNIINQHSKFSSNPTAHGSSTKK